MLAGMVVLESPQLAAALLELLEEGLIGPGGAQGGGEVLTGGHYRAAVADTEVVGPQNDEPGRRPLGSQRRVGAAVAG